MKLRIPPALVAAVTAAIMWIIGNYLNLGWLRQVDYSWIAIILMGGGLLMGAVGILQFYIHSTSVNPHKPERAENLVTSGLYRLSRNPMYLGMLLSLLGWGLYLRSVLSLLMLFGFVDYMNRYQILPEERFLSQKFGEAYLKYKNRVRRWL